MRWPLKNQIFIRLLLMLLVTIAAITCANIRSTLAENRQRELSRVSEISNVLTSTRFPLTNNVLESMCSLSGAEFVVTDRNQTTVARTSKSPAPLSDANSSPKESSDAVSIEIDGENYLYATVSLTGNTNPGLSTASRLHIFVPQENPSSVWWQASKSPLAIALIVLPLGLLVSLALASQVTRPLAQLRTQVQEIAAGNHMEFQPGRRNDEIRDLNLSINEMSVRLRDHDVQVRQNERLQTLLQIGRGLAHNLRNSATGCKMAIELLASEHQAISDSDSIEVARRQLDLMESYIKKFVKLAESDSDPKDARVTRVDLFDTMNKVAFLLSPSASHLGVKLHTQTTGDRAEAVMSEDDAEQLMVNLITNAISAASENAVTTGAGHASVTVELDSSDERHINLTVTDTGPGPPSEIADNIFQPFVSGKKEGIGLGLSLVREIADRIGGTVVWSRVNNQTCFTFKFNKSES